MDETAEIARETGIVAIGLGGPELEFPPAPYAPVFRRAEMLGFHRVAHAGEAAGASSIWGALKSLGVERIGHGTRSFEDPALVEYLYRKRIPLEVCLTSNVRVRALSILSGVIHFQAIFNLKFRSHCRVMTLLCSIRTSLPTMRKHEPSLDLPILS